MNQKEKKIAVDFFSTFKIETFDQSAFLLKSSKEHLMIRTHYIQPDDQETIEQVSNLMDLHLSFDHQYIAPLIHYERCEDGIRAFYHVDQLTLKQQILRRSEKKDYFTEEELWVLLSSVTESLLYLQRRGAIYGVLSSTKIFVGEQIRLMDPSAFNLAPINISRLSLHSPQIAASSQQIDFNQSDVYLLGLCLLEAATLVSINNQLAKQALEEMMKEAENRYSSQILHVLTHTLAEQPEKRPTFQDIKQFLQSEIQITNSKVWAAEQLISDAEDTPSEVTTECETQGEERIDKLQLWQKKELQSKLSQYQKARGRFLQSPLSKMSKSIPSTNGSSHQTHKQSTELSKIQKRAQQSKFVQQFNLSIPETVNKKSKLSRALQIKNRNSQKNKKIVSYQYDNNQPPYTHPLLMSIVKQEKEKAIQHFKTQHFS